MLELQVELNNRFESSQPDIFNASNEMFEG